PLLETDRVAAVAGCYRCALGCRFLIGEWTKLRDRLLRDRYWTKADCARARNLGDVDERAETLIEYPNYDGTYGPVAESPERSRMLAAVLADIRSHLDDLEPREA